LVRPAAASVWPQVLVRPPLPARLADLYERPERLTRLPAELDPVEAFVRAHTRRNTV